MLIPFASTTASTRPAAVCRALAIASVLACVTVFLTACFSVSVTDPDVEAGALIQLTHTDATEENPTWSPDGDKIAFECPKDEDLYDYLESTRPAVRGGLEVRNWQIHGWSVPNNICVVNADGSGWLQLTDEDGHDRDPAWSPNGNRIAFASDRDGDEGIFLINSDGSGLKRITYDLSVDNGPVWSPDGSSIAYTSYNDGHFDIFIINSDGTEFRQITKHTLKVEGLTWSPDGDKLAFQAHRDDDDDDVHIYTINTDGTELTQVAESFGYWSEPTWSPDGSQIAFKASWEGDLGLTLTSPNGDDQTMLAPAVFNAQSWNWLSAGSPAWSPDGTRIAFAAEPWDGGRSTDLELYVINVDGSGLQRITYRAGDDSNPTWSPDGSKLAFESRMRGSRHHYVTPEIFVVADFNPEPKQITDSAYSDRVPVWSPDGARIAYVSQRLDRLSSLFDDSELNVSNADGSATKQLTDNDYMDFRPAWSPDSTRIAYVSDYDGDEDIYTINADGSGIKRLTVNDHPDSRPVWSPDGGKIAYVSLHNGRHTDLFVMNQDGSGVVQLTDYDDAETNHYYGAPSWSPDGTRIAFVSAVHGQLQRHVMNSDGTQLATAGVDNCRSYDPAAWSPDSTMIAFSCQGHYVHLFNPIDGTLTSIEACGGGLPRNYLLAPSWLKDDSHIAYTCWKNPFVWPVRKTNLDNGIETIYDTEGCWGLYHSWSPDESRTANLERRPRDDTDTLCVAEPVLAQLEGFTPR